jgi:hypothetical protein
MLAYAIPTLTKRSRDFVMEGVGVGLLDQIHPETDQLRARTPQFDERPAVLRSQVTTKYILGAILIAAGAQLLCF